MFGMAQDLRYVDPRELRLPSRRGADPFKPQRQIARFGGSSVGMPSPWVYKADGVLVWKSWKSTEMTWPGGMPTSDLPLRKALAAATFA